MAQEQKGIINHWGLIAFARKFGPKMQVGDFSNSETGEEFKSCVFSKEIGKDEDGKPLYKRTFVPFSSKMGELTGRQIASMKDSLQVVQLTSGHYCLCKQGDGGWEDVDLGI